MSKVNPNNTKNEAKEKKIVKTKISEHKQENNQSKTLFDDR